MRSRIFVSIFSLSVAILSLSLGGCHGKNTESTNDFQSISETGSIDLPESKLPENTVNSEPKIPTGEPTIYTAPDDVPIYTGEITKALDWCGDPISPDEIPLNEDSEIFCEGFQYFKEPVGVTFDSYRNPEMFSGMEFTGDFPKNNNPDRRLYVGDEICSLKLTKAITHFTNSDGNIGLNNTITSYGGNIAEFEGMVTLEGFLFITPPNNYEPDGGRLEFNPTENKLPLLGYESGEEPMLCSIANEFFLLTEFGGLHLEQEKFPYTNIDGMGIGDLAMVRVTVSNFCYTNGGGRRAVLEDVEVISDVLKHVDGEF